MADSQLFEILFGDGVDTGSDPRAVTVAKLLTAQNVVFTSPGTLRVRNGHDDVSGAGTRSIFGVFAHNGAPYYFSDHVGTIFDQYGLQRQAQLGRLAGIRRQSVLREGNARTYETDIAISTDGNYMMVASAENEPSTQLPTTHPIIWSLLDAATGETIVKFLPYSLTDCSRPRIAAVGQYFWCFYFAAASGLRGFRVDTVTKSISTADALLDAVAAGPHDTAQFGGFTDRFLYAQDSGGTLNLTIRDATFGLIGGVATTLAVSADCVAVCGTSGERIYLCYRDNATGDLRVKGYTSTGSTPTASFGPSTVKAAWPAGLRVGVNRYDAIHAVINFDDLIGGFYRATAVDVSNAGGVPASFSSPGYGRQWLTKPWTEGHGTVGNALIALAFAGNNKRLQQFDPVQGVAMLCPLGNTFGGAGISEVDGACARLVAGYRPNFGFTLPSTVVLPDGRRVVPLTTIQRQRVNYDYSTVVEQQGVDLAYLNTARTARHCWAELGGCTWIAGGMLRCFDGQTCVEAGFLMQPQQPTLLAVGGGGMTVGDHSYIVVWEWTDTQGNEHRSPPSFANTVTIGAGQAGQVTVDRLNCSNRDMVGVGALGAPATGANVRMAVYHTAVGGTDYFRAQPPTGQATNQAFTDGVDTATPNVTDAQLITFPALYTTGNALASYAPPSCDVVVTHRARLFVISAEDGSIWYTTEYVQGEAPRFNDALQFRVPSNDRPTALASLDDKLVVFTANNVFVVTGEFPDDRGVGANFRVDPIPSEVGAIDWRGVTVGEMGAFFTSVKGIHIVTRALTVENIGHDVQDWTDRYTVVAAYVTQDKCEVRFALNNSSATPRHQELVLNTKNKTQASPRGTWSTFDYQAVSTRDYLDAAVVNGRVYKVFDDDHVGGASVLWREDPTSFDDAGTSLIATIETANAYPFGGRQGFGRVRSATLLGTRESSHQIAMFAFYDGRTFNEDGTLFTRATLDALAPEEQVLFHLTLQKCSGLRFRLQISTGGAPAGEMVRLSGLILETVPKKGSRGHALQTSARQ